MPQKILNDDGEEIEVFTQAELQAQKDSALEEYKKTNPGNEEITKLQEELKVKTEELLKLQDKDLNFTALRQAKEKLEADIEAKIGSFKKELLEGVTKEHYQETMKKLAGDDKELADKIELQYKRLADPASTKEEISKKLMDAFVLASGGNKQSIDSGVFSSGGIGRIKVEQKQMSPEEIEFSKKFAQAGGIKLEDKDFK
jgi:hypothetical protein